MEYELDEANNKNDRMIPRSYNSNNVHSEEVKQSPKMVTNYFKDYTRTEER